MVSKKTLMVKIDKSSINKSIMTNYSWELKSKPIESKNSLFSDPLSLIMAICSNGSWMSFMIDETIGSINFIWFISILHHWIVSNNYYEYNKVLLLLNNWSYHKSNNSMKILKILGYTIAYIPTYSPDFAPIEMCFCILKRNLKESWKKENKKVLLRTNKIRIYNSLRRIKQKIVKKLVEKLYSYINEYI